VLVIIVCAIALCTATPKEVKTSSEDGLFIIQLSSDIRMPEKSEQRVKIEKTIPQYVDAKEFMMIAYTVEQEAHDLSLQHKTEIANVILNRVHHDHFPDNVKGVLTQKNQFDGFKNYLTKKHKPTAETILAVKKSLRTRRNNLLFFYNRERAGHRPFFENNKKLSFVKEIEGHRFFRMTKG
jgi:N-acetylmuramoyl-L-alanine amidase